MIRIHASWMSEAERKANYQIAIKTMTEERIYQDNLRFVFFSGWSDVDEQRSVMADAQQYERAARIPSVAMRCYHRLE